MGWEGRDFLGSLTSVASRTIDAYRRDLAAFVVWAERGGLSGPGSVDRLVLRRYIASLSTRRYARRYIARKASTLSRYFSWCARTGRAPVDPSAGLSVPHGDGRPPRVLKPGENGRAHG